MQHHNASLQVYEEGPARCRLVWIADVLPHAAAALVGAMMEEGVAAMRTTLAAHSVPTGGTREPAAGRRRRTLIGREGWSVEKGCSVNRAFVGPMLYSWSISSRLRALRSAAWWRISSSVLLAL